MLSGFECDEDQTGWLAGLAVWSTGAAAGCLLAVATVEPPLLHWQVLVLALSVSLVSLGLRLPVMFTPCLNSTWLVHAIWMLGTFAQINWVGFLAARSASGTIAGEAILICIGLEGWLLLVFLARGQLPWLKQLFVGNVDASTAVLVESIASTESSPVTQPSEKLLETSIPRGNSLIENDVEELGTIRRQFVDGIDEHGERYLSGSVHVQFEPQQRTEVFALSFCPVFEGVVDIQLECDSEEVTAKVEHTTETGARISVRRSQIRDASVVAVEWYATASSTSDAPHTLNLP